VDALAAPVMRLVGPFHSSFAPKKTPKYSEQSYERQIFGNDRLGARGG
jgi:hypothetical protein